jgi:beta-N-acetylhexosaminidase
MAEALSARGVRVVKHEGEATARSVVLVVRDLQRLPAQRAEVEAALARHADAVLVDMGVPAYRPAGARAYLATHGSARVCAEAAAERMTPG